MSASDWRRIRELFEQSLDLPAAERAAFLEGSCADRPDLRAEVEAMLAADAQAQHDNTSLGAAAPELLQALNDNERQQETDALIGLRLGPWRLLREIGRGGMGAVYLAERDDGEYTQQAAIKLVRPGWDVDELLQRFRGERQILATLNHPNIARLLDGGVSSDGKPYLVLEYVEGSEIGHYCNSQKLGLEARLRLFLTVCDAVSHAHRRLVVHRDLKPSNIMIDGTGQVKLLDFGIAKLIEPEAGIAVSATRMFTPEYAAPEQVRGEAVTTGVDVYALGLLLYDLLTGRRPYGATASTPAAYEQAILTQEPQRPSRAAIESDDEAGSRAAARSLDPAHLSAQLRGDLDAIVLKALRKEPEQRYDAVAAFVEDVQNYLERKPVSARRGNLRYRVMRFLQRHALATGLVLVAVVSLISGLGIALWQAEQARAEARKSKAALEFMTGLFTLADPAESQGEQITARELLTKGTQRIRIQMRDEPAARSDLLLAMGDAYRGLGLFKQALPLLDEARQYADDASAATLSHARVMHDLGRYQEAIDELLELRASQLRLLAIDQDFIDEIDLRLAVAYQTLNQLDISESFYVRALNSQRRRHGMASRQTQEIVLRYVALLILRDRADDARPLTAAVVAAVRVQEPRDDEFFARVLSAHAMVVSNTGPFGEAESLRLEELALIDAIYGPDHPLSQSTRNDLASVYFNQFRYEEAGVLFEQVLRARTRQFSPEHPSIALAANNLGNTLLALQRPLDARPYVVQALNIRLAAFGERHQTTGMSLRALANVEFDLGDLAKSEALLLRAIASFEAALGPNNNTMIGSLNDLVRTRLALGTSEPDCTIARRALILSDAEKEPTRAEAQYQFALLGACQATRGDPSGFQALRTALPIIQAAFGQHDRRTRVVTALLANARPPAAAQP